jgi:hypothetical protein
VYAAVTNILGLIPYPVYEQITITVSTDRGQTWEGVFYPSGTRKASCADLCI